MAIPRAEGEPGAPWLRESKADAAGLSLGKMPLLFGALEQFGVNVASGLAGSCASGVSAEVDAIEATTTFETLAAYEGHEAATLRSAVLDVRLLMILDPQIVEFVIRSIFDAGPARDATTAEPGADPRPRTEFETFLVGEFAKLLATALRDAFASVAPLDIAFEGLERLGEPNILGKADMQAITAKLTIKTSAGACLVLLALPQALLAPVSQKLTKAAAVAAAKPDPLWTSRMQFGVAQARITLTAILDEFEMTLGDISAFTVGGVLALTGGGEGRIRIECAERGVFHCKLGERNDRYALEIEDIISRDPEAGNFASPP